MKPYSNLAEIIMNVSAMGLNGVLTHGQANIVWNAVVVLTTHAKRDISVDVLFKYYHSIHIHIIFIN